MIYDGVSGIQTNSFNDESILTLLFRCFDLNGQVFYRRSRDFSHSGPPKRNKLPNDAQDLKTRSPNHPAIILVGNKTQKTTSKPPGHHTRTPPKQKSNS